MMKLREIAEQLYYKLEGDGDFEISALKYAWDADKNSLAVAFTEKDVANTKARAVLAEPNLRTPDKNFILCDWGGINIAMCRTARLLVINGVYYDYEKSFNQTVKGGSHFGANVTVGDNTIIEPLVSIGENVTIGNNCKIESGVVIGSCTEIGNDVIIRAGSKIGVNCHYHFNVGRWQKSFCGIGRLFIGSGVEIGANTVIQHGSLSDTIIGHDTIIGNLVEIAHDVKIGSSCLIVSQVGICGGVKIGDRVRIYGKAGIVEGVKIGNDATILASTIVTKDIRVGQKVSGLFARDHADEMKRLAKLRRLCDDC